MSNVNNVIVSRNGRKFVCHCVDSEVQSVTYNGKTTPVTSWELARGGTNWRTGRYTYRYRLSMKQGTPVLMSPRVTVGDGPNTSMIEPREIGASFQLQGGQKGSQEAWSIAFALCLS
jgi:hypothetical protein